MPELRYLINDAKACSFQRKELEKFENSVERKRGQVGAIRVGISCLALR